MRSILFVLLSACATEPDVSVDTEAIWAQPAGAHLTTKQILWEQLQVGAMPSYTLASTTTYASNGVPSTTLRAFARDRTAYSAGCLYGYYNVDGEATWHVDAAPFSCADPQFNSDVQAVSWATNRYDLFWFHYLFGSNAHLMHAYSDGTTWHEEDLGATATQPLGLPAIGSWATGHLDILWRDANNDLRRRAFDRNRKNLPGYTAMGWMVTDAIVLHAMPANAAISVAEPAVNEIDVAWRTDSGYLAIGKTTDDSTWHVQNILSSPIDAAPALASWGAGSLMAIASRAGQLHQISRDGSTWTDTGFPSDHPFDHIVAAASPTRANRVDVLASPDGRTVEHALYQESLPGFVELPNPQPAHWCWADSAGAVINYLSQGQPGWTPQQTCDFVGTDDGIYCCGNPADPDCLHGGSPKWVLSDYGIDWDSTAILTIGELRYWTQARHQPVIAHEDHNNTSGGHVIVLRDTYRLGGVDYVEIADPNDNGLTWVWPFTQLITYDGNWNIDYMMSGFSWAN